jgi:tripartite-type tricarboxylate transporter receptor subunit TctC
LYSRRIGYHVHSTFWQGNNMTRAITVVRQPRKVPRLLLLAAASLSVSGIAPVNAQTFPSKPIRAISQFGSGASADLTARVVLTPMAEILGQPIIIENRPGATGLVASEPVARAAPDGYTLLISSPSQLVRFAAGYKGSVDPVKDFTPIFPIGDVPTGLFVQTSLPINTFKEFLDYARANPNKLSYGTSGVGSKSHLAAESIQQLTGVKMVHVPYKVGNQALLDVIAGQLPASLSISDLAVPHMRAGKVKALAILNDRTPAFPGTPAVAEVVPGFIAPPSWVGFSGPANMPQAVVRRLSDAATRAIKTPEAAGKLQAMGWDVWAYPPEEFAAMIKRDVELIARIIRESSIKIEN